MPTIEERVALLEHRLGIVHGKPKPETEGSGGGPAPAPKPDEKGKK
jgi:hypothetical protein